MSPEQARGKPVDRRSDVWSFGVVLWEMLTGRHLFTGETVTDVLVAVMRQEPDLGALPEATPAAVRRLIARCLRKDPRQRLPDIGAARLELQEARQSSHDVEPQWTGAGGSRTGAHAAMSGRPRREQVAWGLAAGLAIAVAGLLVAQRGRPLAPAPAAVRFEVHPPPGTSFPDFWWGSPVVSPDGRQLAFGVEEPSGKRQLWVRSLDSLEARPLDADRADTPFWSPDSRSIAFIADGALKAVDVSGGAARVIAKPASFGGAWSREGVILFNVANVAALQRVPAIGGAVAPATALDVSRNEISHCCAQFLPDGRFLFFALGKTWEELREYVGSLGSTTVTPLPGLGYYAPPGYLLFAPPPRRTLVASSFDLSRLETTGRPVSVTPEPLSRFGNALSGWLSTSDSGVMAYRPAASAGSTRLAWFDRGGHGLGVVAAEPGAQNPELSPDGRRLLFERLDPETANRDVWVMELDRGVASRLSFDATVDESDPLWSPDGRRIVWSERAASQTFADIPAEGGAGRVLFDFADATAWPWSWSPDGVSLLYGVWTPTGSGDVMVLPLTKDAKPQAFAATPFLEMGGQFSPDGRFVVYDSNETGRSEIYIRPFPAAAGKWRVSTDGGTNPRWRADGGELFYIAPDRTLMAVAIGAGVGSPSLSTPRPLFQTRISGSLGRDVRNNYAVSRDGQRFLIVTDVEKATSPPITVILNWPSLLTRGQKP
jgi:hypothetical protein